MTDHLPSRPRIVLKKGSFAFTRWDVIFVLLGLAAVALAAILYSAGAPHDIASGAVGLSLGLLPLAFYGAHQRSTELGLHDELIGRLDADIVSRHEDKRERLAPAIRASYSLGQALVSLEIEAGHENSSKWLVDELRRSQIKDAETLGVTRCADQVHGRVRLGSLSDITHAVRYNQAPEVFAAYKIGLASPSVITTIAQEDAPVATRSKWVEELLPQIDVLFGGLAQEAIRDEAAHALRAWAAKDGEPMSPAW